MDFNDIISLLTNNGIGIACIVYFLFRDYKFMNTLIATLTTIKCLCENIEKEKGKED